MSPELRVMFGPSAAYAALAIEPAGGRWVAVRRPALVALITGTAFAILSTGRITISLAVSCAVCWSFVPALQLATAAAIMRPAQRGSLSTAQRLDLWFMGHAPWSLWMLLAVAGLTWSASVRQWMVIASVIVPVVWTAAIAIAFCRTVLGDTRGGARRRVALHQALTWTLVIAYIALASQVWPRFLALIGR
jgi:hypothetical protein